MTKDDKDLKGNAGLDNRLGTPMKKIDGLSSDKKRAESEHLHAFRDDVDLGKDEDSKQKEE